MRICRTVLLGSAAGLSLASYAQAADLPFRKAAPVEYVRVCDFTGKGYFYIPGTDTCLRVGGFVRTSYAYVSPSTAYFPSVGSVATGVLTAAGTRIPSNLRDVSGFFARGRLEADARTQTAYGTLRTFVRFDITQANGSYQGSTTSQQSYVSGTSSVANLDKGYIQFAGFTAGRVQSFFDFYADAYNFEGIANSDRSTQVFAYTADFGGGFSATLSAEDPTVRRNGIGNSGVLSSTGTAITNSSLGYGAVVFPDAVASVNYTGAWGKAQLAAAYHEITTVSSRTFSSQDENGFAVTANIQIKLPMIAAGDDIWLGGIYQQGAYRYQDSANSFNQGVNNALFLGGFQHIDRDAYAFANANGSVSLSLGEGFSVMGAFHHYFTPTFSDVLFGSYEEISYGGRAKNTDWRLGGIGDASEYRIGNQFVWTPVNNLAIAIEGIYAHMDQDIAGGASAQAAFRALRVAKDPSSFEGRLRLQRDF